MIFDEDVSQVILKSYFKKLKSEKAKLKIFTKYTKRWFVFDTKSKVFSYSKSPFSDPIKTHDLTEIFKYEQVKELNDDNSDWKYPLKIYTYSKVYTLFSNDPCQYIIWCNYLSQFFCEKDKICNFFIENKDVLKEKENEIVDFQRVNLKEENRKRSGTNGTKGIIFARKTISKMPKALLLTSRPFKIKNRYQQLDENCEDSL